MASATQTCTSTGSVADYGKCGVDDGTSPSMLACICGGVPLQPGEYCNSKTASQTVEHCFGQGYRGFKQAPNGQPAAMSSTEQCSCCKAGTGACTLATSVQMCRDGVVTPLAQCLNMVGTAATKVQCLCGDVALVPGQVCNYNNQLGYLVLDQCKGRCYNQAPTGSTLVDVTSNKGSLTDCRATSSATAGAHPYLWLTGAQAPPEGCACCRDDGTTCSYADSTKTCTFGASGTPAVAAVTTCVVTDGTGRAAVDCNCGNTLIKTGQVCNHDNDPNKIIDICQHYPGWGKGKKVENKACACCELPSILATSLGAAVSGGRDRLLCRIAVPGDVCTSAETGTSPIVLIKKVVAACPSGTTNPRDRIVITGLDSNSANWLPGRKVTEGKYFFYHCPNASQHSTH